VKRDIANAEHYVWGDGCDGWILNAAPDLLVIQERMPKETAERRHYHSAARQFFYVLEGELTVELDGVIHRLARNSGIEVAPGVIHQVRNASEGDVDFLVTSSPSTRGDRVDLDQI
jgi:mannose-6-phosphate isomerase-like protein (cupin superfamily)